MSFYLFFLCGLAGGLMGGMGMGGGTLLIPLLTLVCRVEQTAAQGMNLISFLPMSLIALHVHAKENRLQKKGLVSLCLPAVLFSGAFAFLASFLPSRLLRRGFGIFLILLSAFPFFSALKKKEGGKNFLEK